MNRQSYTVSVIANVTIMVEVVAHNEVEASVIVEAMTYEELSRTGRIRIYSTEPVDPEQDVEPTVDRLIADILCDDDLSSCHKSERGSSAVVKSNDQGVTQ